MDLAQRADRFNRMILAELVKVPSDNPPGDCVPHAKRSAELLEKLGFTVERHEVPDDLVKANGMISHGATRKRVSYGKVAAAAAHLNAPKEQRLKEKKEGKKTDPVK